MAQPRLFVSSTCYDLQEIRSQLRIFIDDFGFEPVMSEFGDIFFDYQKHIQDSCKDEIEKCQLFILIVGNNFGSTYYKQKDPIKFPDSVTMQEFRKSMEINIYKHIFVNKFIDYDYSNFQKALNKEITNFFSENEVEDEKIDETVYQIKKDFINRYPFPQDSYKYIFNFLEIIYGLKTNNAIITYETFDDIKKSLRKQWAGFMYESITKQKSIPASSLEKILEKIEKVENQIRSLVESQVNKLENNSKVTFDLSKLANEISFEEFTKIKEEIHKKIIDLLYVDMNTDLFDYEYVMRVNFYDEVTSTNIEKWFISLESLVKKYKWAKNISSLIVFKGLGLKFVYFESRMEIPYDLILNFYNIHMNVKESFTSDDYEALLILFASEFNKLFQAEPILESDSEQNSDLPF